MNISFITESEELGYENDLARFFVEAGIVSESKMNMWLETASVLTENVAKQSDPAKYFLDKLGNSVEVKFSNFWLVFNDIKNFSSNELILTNLGFIFNKVDPTTGQVYTKDMIKNAKREAMLMAKHFAKTFGRNYYIPTSAEERTGLVYERLGFSKLEQAPTIIDPQTGMIVLDINTAAEIIEPAPSGIDKNPDMTFAFEETPTKADIIRGKLGEDRTRGGIIAKKINDLQMFNGVLYTNISKIPKQSLFNWLRLWKKDMVGLPPDQVGFFSRQWKRIFVLGYQVNEKFFYEVWFNTIDSTFSVHDSRGAQMSRRTATMFEAIRILFQQLAKVGLSDGEFIRGGVDKSMVDSLMRALDTNVDALTKEMLSREKSEYEKEQKKYQDEIDQQEQKKQEWEQKKARISNSIKNAISVTGDAVSDMGRDASDGALRISNKVTDKAIKAVGDQYLNRYDPVASASDAIKAIADERKSIEQRMASRLYSGDVSARNRYQANMSDSERVTESFGDDVSFLDQEQDLATVIKQQTNSVQYLGNIDRMRNDAQKDSANYRMIKDAVMGSIEKYEKTRVDNAMLNKIAKKSIFSKIKMRIMGTMFKADFIAGYTVNNRINLEVWYVTEPNPEYTPNSSMGKTISSFYLYDVTSGRLIRKWIPYYRNAEQLIIQKIGVFDLPQQRKQAQVSDQTGRQIPTNRENAQRSLNI